jgi:hypothetical protein
LCEPKYFGLDSVFGFQIKFYHLKFNTFSLFFKIKNESKKGKKKEFGFLVLKLNRNENPITEPNNLVWFFSSN